MPRPARPLTARSLAAVPRRQGPNPHRRLTVAALALAIGLVGGGRHAAWADEWPQWRGPNRDGVWRETGLVERFDAPQLDLRWRAPIGPGYSGPTVADGRVFVMDRQLGPDKGAGDAPVERERILAFAWETGQPLWEESYEAPYAGVGYTAGPRASVTVEGGRAFALGATGWLHALDPATGRILWRRDGRNEYRIAMPEWGIAASPLVWRDLVVVQLGGADGACVVAFDKATGEERWRALDERPSYAAPILIEQAGQDVLVVWTGDSLSGLEPATGKVHWSCPFPPVNMVIGITTPVADRGRIFVSSFFDGSLLAEYDADRPTARELWRRRGENEQNTDALHSIISTPRLEGDYIYGVDSYGELRCLRATDGERVWESQQAVPRERWATIHMVQNGRRTWMFNERGELIIARLSPQGYEEISRAKLLAPTTDQLPRRDGVCWSHPAFAYRHVFARNDSELVCASLAAAEPADR